MQCLTKSTLPKQTPVSSLYMQQTLLTILAIEIHPLAVMHPWKAHTDSAGLSLSLQTAASQPFSFSKTKRSIGVFLISSYYSCYCSASSSKAHR